MKVKSLLCGLFCLCMLSGCGGKPEPMPASEAETTTTAGKQTESTTRDMSTPPVTTTAAAETEQTEPPATEGTEAPTKVPTKAPTKAPTHLPTQAPTSAPTQPPQTKIYRLNETWVVDGQWELTFTAVTRHTFCNRFDNGDGFQECVILTWSYKNLGYTGSMMDLFFSSTDFNVYDASGEASRTYPCTHTENSKECAVGMKCTGAQQAYRLKSASNFITVTVEHYTSNGKGKQKATFRLDISGESSASGNVPSGVKAYEGFSYAPDFGAMLNIPCYQKGEVTIKGSLKSQSFAYSISSLQGSASADTCVEEYDSLLKRCGYSYSETTSGGDIIYMNRQAGSSVMIGVDEKTRMFIVTVAGRAD